VLSRLRNVSRARAIAIAAIASLILCLCFSFVRMLQVREELAKGDFYVSLWTVSQTQYDLMQLSDRLAPLAGQAEDRPASVYLDLAISRLAALLGGQYAEHVREQGYEAKIRKYRDFLASKEVEAIVLDPASPKDQLRSEIRAIAADVRDLMNSVTGRNHTYAEEVRQRYLQLCLEAAAAFLLVLTASIIFTFKFFKEENESNRTRQLLLHERELSELVIQNTSSQGIAIFDEELRCLLWNPGMEEMLAVSSEEATGRNLSRMIPLFGSGEVETALKDAIAGHGAIVEYEELSPVLGHRCLEVHSFPLSTATRRLGIAFVRDVTEGWIARRQAEQQNVDLEIEIRQRTAALQQAERRLIAAIATSPEGFAAFDSTGRLLFANERIRAAEPLTLWCAGEITFAAFLQCFAMCEGAGPELLGDDLPEDNISVDLCLKKDSWVHLSATRADGGTIFVRLTDISGYKRAASALQSALERERETTSAYRNFVSMVSHQFRTPLAILDSSAQRLLRRGDHLTRDEMHTRVQRIRSAATRLTRLVESVLNAARLDAGRMEVKIASCDLVGMVADICERQREMSPQAVIRFEASRKAINVLCDSILIEQVVINLLSNAVKYSDDQPVVDVRVSVRDGRGVCSVRDSGIGIPPDEVSRIFDRFYRARTASGIAGTGIGLNFAQKILHLHGSDIRAESREGVGSIFTFDLSLAAAEDAAAAA
jgi:PAS domain S-box-containing protein